MSKLDEYSLAPQLVENIKRLGFTKPTDIQIQTIPALLMKKDMIASAETGSGKTAAYSLPLLNRVINENSQGLILVPTRELAYQVRDTLSDLTKGSPTPIKVCVVIGGTSMGMQKKQLSENPHIIVATPGRLVDHLSNKTAKLGGIQVLILDEADRMLDMGFYPQIKRIINQLPKARQTVLFSATFPDDIKEMTEHIMQRPERVKIGELSKPAATIRQTVQEVTPQNKNDRLLDELNARKGSVLIFARTKSRTDRLCDYLESYGYDVGRIHGNRSMAQRTKAIESFKNGTIRILVATDIAGRGLDIPKVGHVINYDLPQSPEDYVHRIGRTGRAGADGEALSLVTGEEKSKWRAIEKLAHKSQKLVFEKPAAPSGPRERPAFIKKTPRYQDPRKPQNRGGGEAPSYKQRTGQRPQGGGFKKQGPMTEDGGFKRSAPRDQERSFRPSSGPRDDGRRDENRRDESRRDDNRSSFQPRGPRPEGSSDFKRSGPKPASRDFPRSSGGPARLDSRGPAKRPFKKGFSATRKPFAKSSDRDSERYN